MIIMIFTILGTLIALFEISFAIIKYSKETNRKRRSETILVYNKIFNDTYNLRDKYYAIVQKKEFTSVDIRKNEEIYKLVMNHLTQLEGFAKGLEYEVYDFQTFIGLPPTDIFENFNSLKQFVYDERKIKSYNLLFNDFIYLTDIMSLCIQAKLNGKRIKTKWKVTDPEPQGSGFLRNKPPSTCKNQPDKLLF